MTDSSDHLPYDVFDYFEAKLLGQQIPRYPDDGNDYYRMPDGEIRSFKRTIFDRES